MKDFKRELYDGYNTLYLEKNPELLEALTTATPQSLPTPTESKSEEVEKVEQAPHAASAQNNNHLLGVELPVTPKLGVKFFDWEQLTILKTFLTSVLLVPQLGEKRHWSIG